jgi:hypothetical protein
LLGSIPTQPCRSLSVSDATVADGGGTIMDEKVRSKSGMLEYRTSRRMVVPIPVHGPHLIARRVNRLPGATAPSSFKTRLPRLHYTPSPSPQTLERPSDKSRSADSPPWPTDTPSRSPLSRLGKHSMLRVTVWNLFADIS